MWRHQVDVPTLAGPLAASQPPPTRTEVAPRLMALQKFSRTPFAKRNTMENLGKSWENPQIDQLIFHKYLSVPMNSNTHWICLDNTTQPLESLGLTPTTSQAPP